jgi:RNA polymerase sigma factor (sigma-70 family)
VSVSLSIDGPGDAELISAVRGGDVDAYGELFARHVDAARRLARQLSGPADADDLVSDAFTKVLTVLQRGGGPDLAFRAYLLTAVRRLHVDKIRAGSRLRPVEDLAPFDPGLPFHDTAVEGFDNAAAARAFASLPERWQMVLWHTEVEQQKPADIAPLLGMSANSVSALAYRAREGLRQAFLSQHATDPDDVDCAWTRDHLGAYVRGGLSRRDATRVDDHLAACRACAAVYLELTEVNSGLAGLLAPLLLGTAGAGYLSSTGGAGTGAISSGVAAAKTWAVAHASLTAVGGLVVTTAAVVSIYGATHFHGHSTADLGSPPALDVPAAASTLPSPVGRHHDQRGAQDHRSPGVDTAADTASPSASSSPSSGASLSDDSTAPAVGPGTPTPSSDPSSSSSDPSSGPTDPTSGPTTPTTTPTPPTPDPITFSDSPAQPAIGGTYPVTTRGGSGDVAIAVDPSTDRYGAPDAACSIDPSSVTPGHATVSFDHGGRCVIVASDGSSAARGAQSAATTPRAVTQTIVIPRLTQSIAFTSSAPDDAAVGGGDYTVSATAQGGGVGFATTSAACTVSKDLDSAAVHFVAGGPCVIEADQGGGVDYEPATTVSQSFDVAASPYELKVEATPTLDGSGNPQRIDVVVSGLPAGGTAVLTATGPDDLHVVGGQDCPCAVKGPSQTVQFTYNTKQSPTARLTFSVTTTDSPDAVSADDTVTLDFPMAPPPQSFALRLRA